MRYWTVYGPTHVTASGIVVGRRGTVLHRHKRLGIWMQPGGHIDAGESRLFLVGKYLDTFKIENNKAKFVSREVRIENRRLDKGSHWPI